MPALMIKCPQTGLPIPTGIETDPVSFKNYPDVLVHSQCPRCGYEHSWWPNEAWFAGNETPKREPGSSPPSLWETETPAVAASKG